MQTLYLEGTSPLAVLLEGPALRLRRTGEADVFAPLGRLARVVVRGAVHWRAEALAACMDWNVPVTFLDGGGNARGACVTLRPVSFRSNLPTLLEIAAALPDWPAPWQDWLRAAERTEIQLLRRRFALRVQDLRPATVHRACSLKFAIDAGKLLTLHEGLFGLLEVRLVARLAREGLGPAMLSGSLGGITPARDLAGLLAWRLWPATWRLGAYLGRHAAKHREASAVHKRTVRFFEAEAPGLDKATARWLRELALFLTALTR